MCRIHQIDSDKILLYVDFQGKKILMKDGKIGGDDKT